jgi:hypothetical protein
MPKPIVPARPPAIISSLAPWARGVVRCRRHNPDHTSPVPRPKNSLDSINRDNFSPDRPNKSPVNISQVLSKGSPVSTNPVSLDNINLRRPKNNLDNTSPGPPPKGPKPDNTNQERLAKGSLVNTNPVSLSKDSPDNTNPVSLSKDSPDNTNPGRPQNSLDNTSPGRPPQSNPDNTRQGLRAQSQRGRQEPLSLNRANPRKSLVQENNFQLSR